MKVGLDTNVLLRLVVDDDETQQKAAIDALEKAELVAVSVHALCEFAWVLDRAYGAQRTDIAAAIRRILDMGNVVADRPAIEAGLNVLEAGGDLADGVIAFEGRWLGAETFLSFDKKAVKLLSAQGSSAVLLS